MTSGKVKQSRCKSCGLSYGKQRPLQVACSPVCAMRLAAKAGAKKAAQSAKAERVSVRERKLALKPMQYWLKRAERAVNALVLVRDREQPCISCGTWDAEQWHAGHFISVGASSATRYDLKNIHRQCRQDNFFGAGKQADYEMRLPGRIGQAEVDRLKNAPRERKWTREDLQKIEADANVQRKQLEFKGG